MINRRVDADKPFLGLTNFKGKYITTKDIEIAKNYLSEDELKQLNCFYFKMKDAKIACYFFNFCDLRSNKFDPNI